MIRTLDNAFRSSSRPAPSPLSATPQPHRRPARTGSSSTMTSLTSRPLSSVLPRRSAEIPSRRRRSKRSRAASISSDATLCITVNFARLTCRRRRGRWSANTIHKTRPGAERKGRAAARRRRFVGQVVHLFNTLKIRAEINSMKTTAAAQGRKADAISGENALVTAITPNARKEPPERTRLLRDKGGPPPPFPNRIGFR